MGESLGSYSHVRYADALPLLSYRDDWASRHFLHPKTLRKAREVRTQLLDIMKHQKLDIIPCGTDWDVIRCARLSTTWFARRPPADLSLRPRLQEDDLCGLLPSSGARQGYRRVPTRANRSE